MESYVQLGFTLKLRSGLMVLLCASALIVAYGWVAAQQVVTGDMHYFPTSPTSCLSFDEDGAGGSVYPFVDANCDNVKDAGEKYLNETNHSLDDCVFDTTTNSWTPIVYNTTTSQYECLRPSDDSIGGAGRLVYTDHSGAYAGNALRTVDRFLVPSTGDRISVFDPALGQSISIGPCTGGSDCEIVMTGLNDEHLKIHSVKSAVEIAACTTPPCDAQDDAITLTAGSTDVVGKLDVTGKATFTSTLGGGQTDVDVAGRLSADECFCTSGSPLTVGDGTDADQTLTFNLGAADETIIWDEAGAQTLDGDGFVFSDDVSSTGDTISMGDGTDRDMALQFHRSTVEQLGWLESSSAFVLTDDLIVTGDIQTFPGDLTVVGDATIQSLYMNEQAAAAADIAANGQLWTKTVTPNQLWFTDDAGTDTRLNLWPDFYNGTFVESFNALVTEAGGVVTMSIEKSGTGDLTTRFSSGTTTYDTSPADTIVLTAGTDAVPVENFIYILESAPTTLVKDTSNWPATEHIKVGYFLVPSAAFVAASGVYINQNWNDHSAGTDNQGHMSHIAERSRRDGAYYHSGIAGAGTDGYLTPTASNVELKATAGVIYQMHQQTVPAFDTSVAGEVLVVNWSGDPYHNITNLYDIVADSTGAAIGATRYFNPVIWAVANKGGEYAPMMINLPSCSYVLQTDAQNDANGCDNFTIPAAYSLESSTGFLIARPTVRRQTTWVVTQTSDLRGQTPASASGSVSSVTTPGGATTQVQINLDGAFAGDANMTWSASDQLTLGTSDGLGSLRIANSAIAQKHLNIKYTAASGSYQILSDASDPYAMEIGLANTPWITLDAVGNSIALSKKFNGAEGGQYSKGVWFSSASGITAGASVCARDTNVLTRMVNEVTTASASSCVTLPISPIPGEVPYSFVVVENSGANTLQIWANSTSSGTTGTDTINPGAATSVNLAATKTAIFYDMGSHWSYFEFP